MQATPEKLLGLFMIAFSFLMLVRGILRRL
jgi:hypothetical protein